MKPKTPTTGACRPLFQTEQEIREAFNKLNEECATDLQELAEARREGERTLRRGIL